MTTDQGQPLRYAIVGGAGGIAQTHIQALAQIPGAQIVAISDLDERRGGERATQLGCAFFRDHRPMLAEFHPDVAVICTPHPSHAAIAVDCLRAGAHVLAEKPMAVEPAEGDAMVAAARAAGKILAVNFQQRFRPQIEFMKRFIEGGELGELVRVLMVAPWFRTATYYRSAGWRGTWKGEGGGVLLNQAPHNLDLLCHLAGMPTKVWGIASTRAHAIECEDTAQAMLAFANGATGYLYGSTAEAGKEILQIFGDRASLELSGDGVTVTRYEEPQSVFRASSPEMWAAPQASVEHFSLSAGQGQQAIPAGGQGDHVAVHRDLRRAILTGSAPRADGQQAMMSLELANAIILSSHTERAIRLPVDRDEYHQLLTQLRSA